MDRFRKFIDLTIELAREGAKLTNTQFDDLAVNGIEAGYRRILESLGASSSAAQAPLAPLPPAVAQIVSGPMSFAQDNKDKAA